MQIVRARYILTRSHGHKITVFPTYFLYYLGDDVHYETIFLFFKLKLPQKNSSQRDSDQKNSEDVLFDMFRTTQSDTLPVGKFLAALRTSGIRMNDPRIQEMMENLKKVHRMSNSEGGSPETQNLNRETFKS